MQRSKKMWAIIAVTLAVLTLGAKQADAQTLDSSGKCHDASGKFAAQSVCGTDAKPKATNTKSSDSTKTSTSTKSDSGKIQAEDGSWVNADFYSKTDTMPVRAGATKGISKTDTGNGYFVYAYDSNSKQMACAWSQTNDPAWYAFKGFVDANWPIVRGYWASADAKNVKPDCTM